MELSENAIAVLEKRYLIKDKSGKVVETPDGMFRRVAQNIASAELKHGKSKTEVKAIERQFYDIMKSMEFMPNSPTLMNAGRDIQQLSACFVLPIEDSMESIFTSLKNAAMIHKSGGGTGFAFSRIRPRADPVLSTMGVSSGPISFMRVYNAATEAIKQGGTRRGANMGILRVDHPDIMDFIKCKEDTTKLTNFNISVALTEEFMKAVENDEEYELINPRSKKVAGKKKAREVFDAISDMAWKNGEPGIVFLDRINRDNPTPAIGEIESTNPCVVGSTRLATHLGPATLGDLERSKADIRVTTDLRVPFLRNPWGSNGGASQSFTAGTALKPAVPAFRTRTNAPVFRLVTEHGLEVVATANHKFFTPRGPVKLDALKSGDAILIQSGRGAWNGDRTLPAFTPDNKLRGRASRNECALPKKWSAELGELLGWVVGDGWVSAETPAGRRIPNYTIGLVFGSAEKKALIGKFRKNIKTWTGLKGCAVERNGTVSIFYKSALYYFLDSLGLDSKPSVEKRVPASLWKAPRDAVIGFLRALFTADGTVNISSNSKSCSIRLASSSKGLLQDVQIILLNEGIASKLRLRRNAGLRSLPDSKRKSKMYPVAAQYELILDKANRDRFMEEIGFLTKEKSRKASKWISSKARASNKEPFVSKIKTIEPAGTEDVFCTTEPETHSIIVNGLVTAQCGEQPLLPYESCNLGSINLSLMVKNGDVDWNRLREVVRVSVRFLDDVIDMNNYPLPEIRDMSLGNRKIGLGVMGWADMLVQMGIPYESPKALALAEKVMRFVHDEGWRMSEELAKEKGPFPNFPKSKFGKGKKVRNATVTTIAPTGTISMIVDCSSGVEPNFSVAYLKRVMDGRELPYANRYFEEIVRRRGIHTPELMEKVAKAGHIQELQEIPEDVRKLFLTAHDISPEGHIQMQAAFQKYTDNAVSKTVNMCNDAKVADVARVYKLAYETGCKGVTVYRDGSRELQVLSSGTQKDQAKAVQTRLSLGEIDVDENGKLKPRARPLVTTGSTVRMTTGCGYLYVTINEDERGLFEIFARMGKTGGCAASQTEAIGRLISLSLRSGIDPAAVIKQLRGIRCPVPAPLSKERCLSCPDAVGQALEIHLKNKGEKVVFDVKPSDRGLRPECPECGAPIEFAEGCAVCPACGFSKC